MSGSGSAGGGGCSGGDAPQCTFPALSDRTEVCALGARLDEDVYVGSIPQVLSDYETDAGRPAVPPDSELALLEKERGELRDEPEEELEELAGLYVEKGLTKDLALEVAKQLTDHDALGAHAEAELGIDPDDITSPWNAALASMLSFTLGALLPLLTITLFGPTLRIWVTVVSVKSYCCARSSENPKSIRPSASPRRTLSRASGQSMSSTWISRPRAFASALATSTSNPRGSPRSR